MKDDLDFSAEFLDIMDGRAHLYRLLARVFAREADAEFIDALRSHPGLMSALRGVSRRGQERLRGFFRQASLLPLEDVVLQLAVEHANLFLGAGEARRRPGKPYASIYLSREKFLMQEPYMRIREFYRQSGFARTEEARVPDDHISIVLEFMSRLAESAAEGWRAGDESLVQGRLRQQVTFMNEHILTWVPTFCREVTRCTTSDYYRAFATLTAAFLKSDKEMLEELDAELQATI